MKATTVLVTFATRHFVMVGFYPYGEEERAISDFEKANPGVPYHFRSEEIKNWRMSETVCVPFLPSEEEREALIIEFESKGTPIENLMSESSWLVETLTDKEADAIEMEILGSVESGVEKTVETNVIKPSRQRKSAT